MALNQRTEEIFVWKIYMKQYTENDTFRHSRRSFPMYVNIQHKCCQVKVSSKNHQEGTGRRDRWRRWMEKKEMSVVYLICYPHINYITLAILNLSINLFYSPNAALVNYTVMWHHLYCLFTYVLLIDKDLREYRNVIILVCFFHVCSSSEKI